MQAEIIHITVIYNEPQISTYYGMFIEIDNDDPITFHNPDKNPLEDEKKMVEYIKENVENWKTVVIMPNSSVDNFVIDHPDESKFNFGYI